MAGTNDRRQHLETACKGEQARHTANQEVSTPALVCRASGDESPWYYHLGLGVSITQYGIANRKMSLHLAAVPHGKVHQKEHVYGSNPGLPLAAKGKPPKFKQVIPPASQEGSPAPFEATFTGGGHSLKSERTVPGYQLDGSSASELNKLMGTTIAVHLQRTGVIRTTDTGNFRDSMLGMPQPGLSTTEMLGIKVYTFMRAKVDGAMGIREVIEGGLERIVSESVYNARKLAQPKVYSGPLSGGMPLIPGVYQVYVLLHDPNETSEGRGQVSLQEVHCDGDPLFP